MYQWIDDQRLEIRGTRFVATTLALGGPADQFTIVKPPGLVRRYLALLEEERPRRIVELGIKTGGSTALLALAAEPEIFLAVDLEPEIPPLLRELVEREGLTNRVVTAFGLDQGDRESLTGFVDAHTPAGGFDLVIDDASHILGPTRVSFEVLFPRLRPGGLFVVEDWSSEWVNANRLARAVGGEADFGSRLDAVNRLFRALNSPEHPIPPEVVASLGAAASAAGEAGSQEDVFDRIADAASRADLSGLDALGLENARPLSDLAVELTMIATTRRDVVAELRIDANWLSVRRGDGELPRDGFRLTDAWTDFFGYLR